MLEARGVVGAYGLVEVVKGVSLTVRAGELVHVLADACPLAQRRPIVEQNPHGRDFDSFFTRVLA